MKAIQKITYTALFLTIGLVLPFFTGQMQQFGNMLLPMHLPVLLCSFICGWKYGFILGLTLPIFRSVLFSMPVMYPVAIGMAAELATYGFVAGLIYHKSSQKCLKSLYFSLVLAMLLGRIVWGTAQWILLGVNGQHFTWELFLAEALTNAVPGIILQLILIPVLMLSLGQTKLFLQHKKGENDA